jgi:flagellar motor protein MotB
MFRRRVISKKTGEGENPFLLTFSDFMASLLAIFILVLIVTLIELKRREKALDDQRARMTATNNDLIAEIQKSLEDIRRLQERIAGAMQGVSQREHSLASMLDGIQRELKARDIEVALDETKTVLRIPEQQLQFALGKYDIPSEQASHATAIGEALLSALSNPDHLSLLDTVFIEGHTDSVPSSKEMGNWGLSTYRAISLWNFWTIKPGTVTELKSLRTRPIDPSIPTKPLISVSGYAETRSTHQPFDAEKLPADRPEDRRIDIRFTLVSSEKQNLEGLDRSVKEMRAKTDALIGKLKQQSHGP